MLSKDLVLKCFPNKECILYNLDTAFTINNDAERISHLIECYHELMAKNYVVSAKKARLAGYNCMAQAIELHFGV